MQSRFYVRFPVFLLFTLIVVLCGSLIDSLQRSVTSAMPAAPPSRQVDKNVPSIEEWDKMVEQYSPKGDYRPDKGYVPDTQTAVRIAEAVLIPIYGEEDIKSQRPFRAALKNSVWIVTGTLSENIRGGTAVVSISKKTGCVLGVIHYK